MILLIRNKEQIKTLIEGGVKPIKTCKDGSIWIFKTPYSSMLLDSLRVQEEYKKAMAELAAFYKNQDWFHKKEEAD